MLLQRIDRFVRAKRMTPTRFGREAMGDPNFLLDLRDGRQLRPATTRKLEAWLDAQERQIAGLAR
jgi:hypothetical protein